MSADTTPIAPARFAAALKDLSIPMLHLKVLEIRNSIAHLQYSNDQLRPFAEGASAPLSSTATTAVTSDDAPAAPAQAQEGEPDQDCIDAIRENEGVIERMTERIALIKLEVEERGHSWQEFEEAQVKKNEEETAAQQQQQQQQQTNGEVTNREASTSSPWTDGTFQTGTISNGEVHYDDVAGQSFSGTTTQPAQGGTLSDEQIRAALEERMRNLATDQDGEEEKGMHL